MNQQKRFQSGIEFIINLISLFASHAVAYLIFGLIIPKIQNYERNDRVEYTIVLLLSAIIVSLYFSVEINFSVRNREFELTSTLKNCFLSKKPQQKNGQTVHRQPKKKPKTKER